MWGNDFTSTIKLSSCTIYTTIFNEEGLLLNKYFIIDENAKK